MQKKLIALALAGGLLAPLAAQAQNVQIYGLLRPSLDFMDNGDESGSFMQANNSRLGFKGSEDLGGGLKAIFQLESALGFDERGEGDDFWMNRDSWVGLAGSFGAITIGNHQSAYVKSSAYLDPFGDSIGDYNNIMSVVAVGPDNAALIGGGVEESIAYLDYNSRFKNSIYYTSPKFGGAQILASYALRGEGFDDDAADADFEDDNTYSLAVKWSGGPVTAVVAYERQEYSVGTGGDADFEPTALKVGASFKVLPTTTLFAMVDRIDTDTEADKRTGWYIGAKHSMGNIDVMASFMKAGDTDGLAAGAGDDGAKAFALGAAYNFSKRTNIAAYYAQVDNDDDGFYGIDSGGYAPSAAGEKVSGFSVRLNHKF